MSKTDGKWFSHDNNTLSSPKIMCLEAQYGFEGSGRFWRLMETIHAQEGYKFSLTQKVAYASLAMALRMSIDELKQFLHYLIDEIQLIQTDGEYIWNDSMLRRMEYWGEKQKSYSDRGKKGAAIKKEMQAKLDKNDSLAKAELDEKQANKTKPNETILNETKQNNTNNTIVVDDSFLRSNKGNTNTTNNTVFTLSELRDRCADDAEFCATYTQLKKIPFDKLYAWLNAFNKWLVYTADTRKDEQEYRKHFRNWFHQRNWQHETPDTYNPVGEQSFSKQPQRAIPLEMPRKTGQELLAEREAAEQEMIRKLKAM
jgi:hypothetical protein